MKSDLEKELSLPCNSVAKEAKSKIEEFSVEQLIQELINKKEQDLKQSFYSRSLVFLYLYEKNGKAYQIQIDEFDN